LDSVQKNLGTAYKEEIERIYRSPSCLGGGLLSDDSGGHKHSGGHAA
jgi:hypothetical protein